MPNRLMFVWTISALMLASQTLSHANERQQVSRTFRFHYRFALSDLKPGSKLRVWVPVPRSDTHQSVTRLPVSAPASVTYHTESAYGNRLLYFEMTVPESGKVEADIPYEIERREVQFDSDKRNMRNEKLSAAESKRFLGPNARVPLDGKPIQLLADLNLNSDPLPKARQIYNLVDAHVKYDKSADGWGRGDVLWVCDSRFGNCTDFHSLFISLARSQNLPAKFEIGFSIPSDSPRGAVGGYHCWAWFHANQHGWVAVDISEADKHPSMKTYYFGNLTPDRVAFTVGRDLVLKPQQNGPPLNFFIYPYAEQDGKPVAAEKFQYEFSYEDLRRAKEP